MNTANDQALELHEKFGGKITTALRDTGELDRAKLSAYYSPGVAAVCQAIAADEKLLPKFTWTNNLVAVISNGTAVLGLGDIGPKASMPVMEGKALLFKHFADVDAVPIILNATTADEIVATVRAIAPSFGAINLEDIAAPLCFEVEDRLKAELDIPVMHDDQHGTAIVVLAGLINAMKIVEKNLADCKIVIVGAGAAGTAIAKLLKKYGTANILAVDSRGILSSARDDLNAEKQILLEQTNPEDIAGSMNEAIAGADVFIGVSRADLLTPKMVEQMADKPVVFALANPNPEISYEAAAQTKIAVLATGRSDYPNQVNNALAFPGIFRGALDHGVKAITDAHKLAAAEAIAGLVAEPTAGEIIPSPFDERVVPAVAAVIV